MEKKAFIASIVDGVVNDAVKKGVLPSLTLAQAILESGWGNSELAYKHFNYFGIKAGNSPQFVLMPTKEYIRGKWVTVQAKFRKYASVEEGIADHTNLFHRAKLGNGLRYQKVLDAKDYKQACIAVRECGYATDPNYTKLLTDIIEQNGLQKYDEFYWKIKECKKRWLEAEAAMKKAAEDGDKLRRAYGLKEGD